MWGNPKAGKRKRFACMWPHCKETFWTLEALKRHQVMDH